MRRRLAGGLFALPLALTLAVAGCGGSDEGEGVATAGGGAGAQPAASVDNLSDEERQLKFFECMRENGVDMPDPEPGGGMKFRMGEGIDPQKAQAAMEKCRSHLPNGGEMRKPDAEQAEQMRQLAKCMRENGMPDFPDPDADGRIKIEAGKGGIKPNDPKMKAAREKCQQYAPNPGGGNR